MLSRRKSKGWTIVGVGYLTFGKGKGVFDFGNICVLGRIPEWKGNLQKELRLGLGRPRRDMAFVLPLQQLQ